MKQIFKPALIAGLSLVAVATAGPAAAQVNGIATSQPEAVLLQAQAVQTAYSTINSTYASQAQQAQALQTEINNLQASLDTNGDREVNQAEWDANPGVTAQIEAKQQQRVNLIRPLVVAQYYVVEQVLQNYGAAQNQVVSANNIQMILDPSAFQYASDAVDVTPKILAALNQLVPSVATTPPADWRPRRETVAMHQAIDQLANIARAVQQQQAQGQPQTSGR